MLRKMLFCVLLLLQWATADAHELAENRLTMVSRDRTHIALTFFLDYPVLLHRILVPKLSFQEFLVVYSTMPLEQLDRELLRAQRKFRDGTLLTTPQGSKLEASNWVWPGLLSVQTLLRQQAMQVIVGAATHQHEAPTEVRAEVATSQEVGTINLELVEEVRPILVVSYRPSQVWIQTNAISTEIRF